jgi:hypothetical protein
VSAATGYAFFFAPNKLGMRHDLALLSRLFYDNALTFVLFNLLGLFPFILNCLMWPTLRGGGRQVGSCALNATRCCPDKLCTVYVGIGMGLRTQKVWDCRQEAPSACQHVSGGRP